MNSKRYWAVCSFGLTLSAVVAAAQEPIAPFDRLERRLVPAKEISDVTPKELVAILGSHRAKGNGRIALHPSEAILASAEFRTGVGVVHIWNATTLDRIAVLRGHTGPVADVAFSPDGKTLATVAADKTVRLWSVSRRHPAARTDDSKSLGFSFQHATTLKAHQDAVHCVAFSPDGKMMATGEVTGRVIVWSLRAAKAKQVADLPSPPPSLRKKSAVAFSADSRRLAVGYLLETVLWDVASSPPQPLATLRPQTGKLTRTLDDHPSVVESVAFSPSGRWLAVGRYNSGGVRLWDMEGDFQREAAWLDGHTTRTVVFSPDGKTIYSGGTRSGHIWDVETLKLRGRFSGRWGLAPLRDGRTLISTFSDSTLHRLDTSGTSVREMAPLLPHEDVRSVAISNDGRTMITNGRAFRLLDVGAGLTVRSSLPRGAVVALTPDDHQMVTASQLGIVLWDVSGKTPARLRQIAPPVNDQVFSLVVSPDGRYLAMTVRWGANMRLWDLTQTASFDPIANVEEYGVAFGFSSDGRTVVTGHLHQRRVTAWDLSDPRSPKRKYQINDVANTAMSADGRWLATADETGLIHLWELQEDKAELVREFRFLDEPINSIAFDRERRLVVSYKSCRLVVGDLHGETIFEQQFDESFSARFSPDGRHIVTSHRNGVVYVLRLEKYETR